MKCIWPAGKRLKRYYKQVAKLHSQYKMGNTNRSQYVKQISKKIRENIYFQDTKQ
jgi:hypothetical protein